MVHHPTTLAQRQQKTGENRGVLKIKELQITLDAKRQKIIDEIEQFLSDWMAKWVSSKNHKPPYVWGLSVLL